MPDGAPPGRARRPLHPALSRRTRHQNTDTWDAHEDIVSNHRKHAAEADRPIAGLLDSTLVIFPSEFGRDHNPGAMSLWMAGPKIRGGQTIGSIDEFGYKAAEQPVNVHDLHATILHLPGMDHTRLTYAYQGRQMRLTDVFGEPIRQICRLARTPRVRATLNAWVARFRFGVRLS